MSNATAAGPNRGLLDMIFGSGQQEPEVQADGQGFGNLMKLMSALNAKKEAEEGTDAGRTLRETVLGKSIAEGNGSKDLPGMSNNAVQSADLELEEAAKAMAEEEKLKAERLGLLALMGSPVVAQPQPAIKLDQVNGELQQKGLPPLSAQEMKLLSQVNGKLAQADQQKEGVELPAGLALANGAEKMLPKAANANVPPIDPQLQKALQSLVGVDSKHLKAAGNDADAQIAGAPEKLLTTETYLQMHESMNAGAKTQPKELADKGTQPNAPAQAARAPEGTLTANAVSGAAQKGLGARTGDSAEKLDPSAKQAKLDAAAGGTFGATLAQKSDSLQKDLYLPEGAKPEQVKSALVAELGTNVSFHAHKGGGEMKIVLHPDDMGEVRLKVGTKNGKVEVQVTAENEDVAKLLRGGSKDLESSLKEQNLSLAKFEVQVGDNGNVVATDTKTSLNEQFLSQNQQQHRGGFAQANSDDGGRNARWGGDQGSHQGGGYSPMADESSRNGARMSRSAPQSSVRPSMGSSRRLDVVA